MLSSGMGKTLTDRKNLARFTGCLVKATFWCVILHFMEQFTVTSCGRFSRTYTHFIFTNLSPKHCIISLFNDFLFIYISFLHILVYLLTASDRGTRYVQHSFSPLNIKTVPITRQMNVCTFSKYIFLNPGGM
jgi:hypothetical protein